jgi:small-conductance mechanosensitive channel
MPTPTGNFFPTLPAALDPLAVRALIALVIVLITWRAASTVRQWFDRVSQRSRADVNLRVLLSRFFYFTVLVYGLLWALEVLGVSPAAILTSLGVFGLAVGLAVQDILRNFFAGIYLLFERPFRLGDKITVRDHHGTVVEIGLRTTSLRTDDDIQVLIPNGIVLAEVVINRSSYPSAASPPAPPPGQEVAPTPDGPGRETPPKP